MKRIIIPAGTVSGKKDYILEIPIDANERDENAIYILDDKSSRGSMKSLSDYFYEQDSRNQLNQEYMKQYLYEDLQNSQSQSYDDSRPPNYMMKEEYNNRKDQYVAKQNLSDISQSAKYQYYKSIGFTESELYKLLSKKATHKALPSVHSQRKQMKFNRLGVSDFTSPTEDQNPYSQQYEYFVKPIGNANVNAYGNMMVHATYSDVPKTASTSFERSQKYYEDYPTANHYGAPIDAGMYKKYSNSHRTPVSPTQTSSAMTKQSYTVQHNATALPVNTQQTQNAYYQSGYYPGSNPTTKVRSPSKTLVATASKNQTKSSEAKTYQNISRTPSPTGISNDTMENYQKSVNSYPRQVVDPRTRIYRKLPGTSVVSNVPNIRLKNPVVS